MILKNQKSINVLQKNKFTLTEVTFEDYYDGIHYLNSGDWVESLSALTEDADGNWNIMEYHHVLADENEDNKEFTLIHTAS